MNKFFYILTFNILIPFIFFRGINSTNIQCSTYKDCFNCSVCGQEESPDCQCKWEENKSKCEYSPVSINTGDWKNYYKSCVDYGSKQIQKSFCGEFIKVKNKYVLEIPQKNGYYGLDNLYCTYIFTNQKTSSSIFDVNFQKNQEDIYIDYIIYYTDSTYNYINLKNEESSSSFSKVKFFEFFVYLGDNFRQSPFKIEIEIKDYSKIIIIGTILIISIFCIVCGISIYCFSKRLINETRSANNHPNGAIIIRPNGGDNYIIEEQQFKKKKIEEFLNDPQLLGSKICKKEYEKYGNNCTICLEEFKIDKDQVSVTPCHHVFHYKCLSNYMKKSITNTHCPNCNGDLLVERKTKTIQIERKNNNNLPITSIRNNNNRNHRRNNTGNTNENNNVSLPSGRQLNDRENRTRNERNNNNNNVENESLEIENL